MFIRNKTGLDVRLARAMTDELAVAAVVVRRAYRVEGDGLAPIEELPAPLPSDPPDTSIDPVRAGVPRDRRRARTRAEGAALRPLRRAARRRRHAAPLRVRRLRVGARWGRPRPKPGAALRHDPVPVRTRLRRQLRGPSRPPRRPAASGVHLQAPPQPRRRRPLPRCGARAGAPLPNIERPDQLLRRWNDDPLPGGFSPCPDPTGWRLEAEMQPNIHGHLARGGTAADFPQQMPSFRLLNHAPPDLLFDDVSTGTLIALSGLGTGRSGSRSHRVPAAHMCAAARASSSGAAAARRPRRRRPPPRAHRARFRVPLRSTSAPSGCASRHHRRLDHECAFPRPLGLVRGRGPSHVHAPGPAAPPPITPVTGARGHAVGSGHGPNCRIWRVVRSVTTGGCNVLQSGFAMLFVPHVPVLAPPPHPLYEPPLLVMAIPTSTSAPVMSAHSVTNSGQALATAIVRPAGRNLDCGLQPQPTGIDVNLNSVKTSPTLGDYLGAAVGAWLNGMMNVITGFAPIPNEASCIMFLFSNLSDITTQLFGHVPVPDPADAVALGHRQGRYLGAEGGGLSRGGFEYQLLGDWAAGRPASLIPGSVANRAYRILHPPRAALLDDEVPWPLLLAFMRLDNQAVPPRPPSDEATFEPHKPLTDVLLAGSAHAANGPVTSLDTGVEVGAVRQGRACDSAYARHCAWSGRAHRVHRAGRRSHPCPSHGIMLTAGSTGTPGSSSTARAGVLSARRAVWTRRHSTTSSTRAMGRAAATSSMFIANDSRARRCRPWRTRRYPRTPERILSERQTQWIDRPVAACYAPIDLFTFPRSAFGLRPVYDTPERTIRRAVHRRGARGGARASVQHARPAQPARLQRRAVGARRVPAARRGARAALERPPRARFPRVRPARRRAAPLGRRARRRRAQARARADDRRGSSPTPTASCSPGRPRSACSPSTPTR